MFHIAGVAAWRSEVERRLIEEGLPRALAGAGGAGVHSERLPGACLGVVVYGTRGQIGSENVAVDQPARVAVAGALRLDNLDEVKAALGAREDARTAAVLIEAYRRWGDSFPARLKGDFAGVIWDWERQRMLAFRDQLGVRPLFYAAVAGGIAVASEVELLRTIVGDGGPPDDRMIVEHLSWQFHSVDRTFWSRLRRLPGGHVLEATAAQAEARPYWNPPPLATMDRAAVDDRFRSLFFQGVRRRLAPDRPTLAHLSGGIDSSAIVCVAGNICGRDPDRFPSVRTLSARYPGLDADEGEYIDAVTRAVSLPSESWDGRNRPFPDLSDPSIAGPGFRSHRSDGTLDEFAIAARWDAGAILSGLGGDQLGSFSGLPEHLTRSAPLSIAWRIASRRGMSWSERAARTRYLLRVIAPEPLNRLWARYRGRRAAPDWLHARWREVVGDISASRSRGGAGRFESSVQEAHWRDLMGGAMAHALDADHRISTRHAVEMRYPFLDHDLVSFVLSLSPESWPKLEPYGRLQRTALSDVLPAAILGRTAKAAFSPVVAARVRHAAPQLRALFFEGPWASERWVSRRAAQVLLDRAISSTSDDEWGDWQALRAMATLEAWLRRVFGYDTGAQGWRPGGDHEDGSPDARNA
jgi:asparagine synthase (glutamine-hydrolysing)